MHTKDQLAAALRAAGLRIMADAAANGYYHSFLSPLVMPDIQLVKDLGAAGTEAAHALRQRAMAGEFAASREEAEQWADGIGDGQALSVFKKATNRPAAAKQRPAAAKQRRQRS